jgi:hypothetical protein
LIAGTLAMAVQYPILAEVHGIGATLVLFTTAAALASVLYYVASNAVFAALSDKAFRGRQLAARQVLAGFASVVAPLAGAYALVTAGPLWTFAGVALVQASSAAPLFGLPNIPVRKSAPDAWRAARPAALLIALDGWFDAGFVYVWQIALFIALGERFTAYGGAMALAGLVGAMFGMFIGHAVDKGHGHKSAVLAAVVTSLVVMMRAASLRSPLLAAAANALGGFVLPLLVPPLSTATNNIAQASSCPMRVKMATEGAWDIGCVIACLVAAGLVELKVPLALGVLLPLPATVISARLLWRYYSRDRMSSTAA